MKLQELFVRQTGILIILLSLLAGALIWNLSHAITPPSTVRVLSCTTGGNTFNVVAPTGGVSMNVSPNATGSPSLCGLPASFAQTYFVKTTVDGGKTWQWTYHLSDFGFPTAGGTTPVTPPVTPTCPDTFVPMNWTCSTANGVATCTAPLGVTP